MKIPRFDFEQKAWITMLVLLISLAIVKFLKMEDYAQYFFLGSIILLGTFCYIAHKKNWIKKEISG